MLDVIVFAAHDLRERCSADVCQLAVHRTARSAKPYSGSLGIVMTTIEPEVQQACENFSDYVRLILEPAMNNLLISMQTRPLHLHEVFGANLFLAHAVDYVLAIRRAGGRDQGRVTLVQDFDRIYGVGGARIGNRKFELIDAINNSLKHISLDPTRYGGVLDQYGPVTFRSLVEHEGLVLCILEGYRFDYTRVVLRPAFRALSGLDHESVEDVLEFARGESVVLDGSSDDELMSSEYPADAIDQMIAYCNPACEDCDEGEEACRCAQFKYDGTNGEFVPRFRVDFDFDAVMSHISGAYRQERD